MVQTIMILTRKVETSTPPWAPLNSLFSPPVGLSCLLFISLSRRLPLIHAPTGPLADILTERLSLPSTAYPQYLGSPASLPWLYFISLVLAYTTHKGSVMQ